MRALFRSLALTLFLVWSLPALADEVPFPKPLQAQIQAAKESMMTDQAQALRHVGLIDGMAQRLPDQRQRALALATARWLGAEAHLRSDAAERAAPLLIDGLKLISGISEPLKLRGDLLMSQGALNMQRNDAVKALANYQEAFRIFSATRELRSQAMALQNIGALYSVATDNNRAEQYYRQAAELYDGDPTLSLSLRNRRGNILATLGRSAEAEKEYEAALLIARQLDKPLLEARILVNLARNQVDLKRFEAADRTLARGFKLVSASDADLLRRHLLATSARLAADRGDKAAAVRLIRECFSGVDLTTTTGDFRISHFYAYEILRDAGDIRSALAHLEAMKRLDEETTKVATSTGAALMAARFNSARQEAAIEKLKTDEARRTAAFQRTLFLSIGGATLVIIALLSFGLITLRRSRNQIRATNVVLGDTNVALEKALRAKTEFLATTSHEIRTPLNGILGMTQVMLADPKLEAETRDRIGIVHGAGMTMRSLVDDILDVAKMETGNLTVEAVPLDLCATLREVTRLWEEQARGKGLTFRLELTHAPGWIVSDAGRLRQIVFNLLSNAIKFTERGGVTLRAVAEGEGDARRLRLVVTDTGIGIPTDKFEEVFESFRQVDAGTTRQFGGTGLGLTICRNLARALGGEIAVESVEGQGATFTVDLPLVAAEAPAEAASDTRAGGTMVILDRNPIARSILRTLLEPKTASLRFAATTEEALSMIQEGGVTHLLLDEATLKAGDAAVLEAVTTLAAASAPAICAVLWMKPDIELRSQLLATGIGQVIEKPIAGAALVAAIIPDTEENSGPGAPDPLVSQAA
ncbi:tetratricopeptide repeat-containing sensor histidine kinase [Sphingomonas sp. UNC305MFCol5.2]|uniref:tetratricopeptide repeat-containing sensor histidine kinase n=1 Tax=Sphingomonas sp. UNC305MFCol5.2 TaxID=1449076 RepID=UPI00040885FC|nr:ATP-binding protein [Sphingomonas sp. UNC305MFCol5.2]